jgi:UDP-N-acetylglucosamine:LPS N-acetylglucosamine transferase
MSTAAKPLEEMIRELSPRLKNEVQIFVETLLNKPNRSTKNKLRQDWAGMLRIQSYTSLELQQLANEWRDS